MPTSASDGDGREAGGQQPHRLPDDRTREAALLRECVQDRGHRVQPGFRQRGDRVTVGRGIDLAVPVPSDRRTSGMRSRTRPRSRPRPRRPGTGSMALVRVVACRPGRGGVRRSGGRRDRRSRGGDRGPADRPAFVGEGSPEGGRYLLAGVPAPPEFPRRGPGLRRVRAPESADQRLRRGRFVLRVGSGGREVQAANTAAIRSVFMGVSVGELGLRHPRDVARETANNRTRTR